MNEKDLNETEKPVTTETSEPVEIPQEVKPKQDDFAISIPRSLWMKIVRAGLKEKFYQTDAITRAFLGDDLSDILGEIEN